MDLTKRPIHGYLENDGPGHLSSKGSRHDNDFVDYKKIQILPTTDEIFAVKRPPYVPKKNLSESHHLGHGPARLLDTLFRQLRYDSTEGLRDCCYAAAQNIANNDSISADDPVNQETESGRRFYLYRMAKIESIFADERKGLIVQVSFDCPGFMRKDKMSSSGRLEEGMLCALVFLGADRIIHFTFFEIHLRQSTFAMDSCGGNGLRAAVQVSFALKDKRDDVRRVIDEVQGGRSIQLGLIEFPGALYAGFYWHLKKLQELQGHNLAFFSTIAPLPTLESQARKSPRRMLQPAYTSHEHYEVDLTPITGRDLRVPVQAMDESSREGTLQVLRDHSSLDDGQATALCDALSNEIAFVQGPPGTGKTYLGIAILRTLLASRTVGHKKPILVVCLTNHALDSFLKGLVDAGIDSIARIGGKSREEWTKKYLLKTLARKSRPDQENYLEKRSAELSRRDVFNDLNGLATALAEQNKTGTPSWYALEDYLQENFPMIYQQLITDIDSSQAQYFAFQYWAGGGDLKNLEELHEELRSALYPQSDGSPDASELDAILAKIHWHAEQHSRSASTNVWRLSLKQRTKLIKEWATELDYDRLAQKLVDLQLEHCKTDERALQARQKIDAQLLAKRDVIGMTTTACARYWSLLKQLDIEIVVCEEAGEVMEAHTLCTLFQTVEHAIFIGDPLQLRPQIEEPLLKTEMREFPEYRLDESLFEKFMAPRDPNLAPIITSRLNVQRRMHPEIADITRLTYPELLDHSLTELHPATDGLEQRMYWFDHAWPENSPENSPTKSFSNDFEADMIFGLIKYFLRGGAYALGEIAILTPYKGQLKLLKKKLSAICSVWLHPKDRQMLIDDGLLEDFSMEVREELAPVDLLRLATVDNFQGEEAKIIILSTVRTSSPGFLRTGNRINVMCSRARDGFYVFGNAQILRDVPMWNEILSVFSTRRGNALMTCCSRHPAHRLAVTHPFDFDRIRECPSQCLEVRPCGHICLERCHSAPHNLIPCMERCLKLHSTCGHRCNKLCSEECGKNCNQVLAQKRIGCGHVVNVICPGITEKCSKVIDEVQASCGHKVKIFCSKSDEDIVCHQQCGTPLPCGHLCARKCAECASNHRHLPCTNICGKALHCGHSCVAECHEGAHECPPCSQPCQRSCAHGKCKNICSESCDPCVRPHKKACEHAEPGLTFCSLPSPSIPCNHPCPKILSCGHPCPSLCGEPCIPKEACLLCTTGENPRETSICLRPCGHVLNIEDLDAHFLTGIYRISTDGTIEGLQDEPTLTNTTCPVCLKAVFGGSRYAIVDQLAHAVDNEDRLMLKMGRELNWCSSKIRGAEMYLERQLDDLRHSIRPNPLAATKNRHVIQERSKRFRILSQIINTQENVALPFQITINTLYPVIGSEYLIGNTLPFVLRFGLLLARGRTLWVQDNLRVADVLCSLHDPSEELPRVAMLLRKDSIGPCIESREMCLEAIDSSKRCHFPSIEAEFHIHLIHFKYLEAHCREVVEGESKAPDTSQRPSMDEDITEHIRAVTYLCKHYPRTTGRFSNIVDELSGFLSGPRSSKLPPSIHTKETRETERLWGEHKLGHLTACPSGHPYSRGTFDSCPECEDEVLDVEQQAKASQKYLFEEDFLAKMKMKTS